MKTLNQSVLDIVSTLSDGEYHDGTSLGEQLNITRSAVWKVIKKLEHYGVSIDSVKGKGYALKSPLVLLEAKPIQQNLTTKKAVVLEVLEKIDSTNNYLKTLPPTKQVHVCLAEQQLAGKGRLNREWYSPFGQNLYCSYLYPIQKDVSELAGLSLVVGLAMQATVKAYSAEHAVKLKWPNDLIHEGKKLGGCLVEIQAETNGFCYAIIGIGINVNMTEEALSRVDRACTSLQTLLNRYIDRNQLAAVLIDNLNTYLARFEEKGFSDFIDEWQTADSLFEQKIRLDCMGNVTEGTVAGVNALGHLLLKNPAGEVKAFSSGDTTVVKE